MVLGVGENADVSNDLAPRVMQVPRQGVEPAGPRLREGTVHALLWGVLGLAVAVVIAAVVLPMLRGTGAGLPIHGMVPPFALTERSGAIVSADDLRGRMWIANFIFTRCPGICPTLSTRMAALQRRLEGGTGSPVPEVSLVSISVDPARDTPEILRAYAQRFGALPGRWLFLTGAPGPVRDLVREGFHLSVDEAASGANGATDGPITHSDRFVLVDEMLRIRGYFHGTDEGVEGDILGAVARLRDEAGS